MAQLSNWFVGFLNFCSLLLGLFATAYAVYLMMYGGSACQKSIHVPLLITGLLVIMISLLGFVGYFYKLIFLINAYLFVMLLLGVGLLTFAVFALVFASREDPTSGNYELEGKYSRWLEKHFVDENSWNVVRGCLIEAQVCKKIDRINADMATGSYGKTSSPIQLHCCMPPTDCDVTVRTVVGSADMQWCEEEDCCRWSNDEGRRCYHCNSCKAGVIEEIKREWRFVAIGDVCVVVLNIIIFCAACCAKRNNNPPKVVKPTHV